MRCSSYLAASALLCLFAQTEATAVPVRVRAEPVGGATAATDPLVTVRLIPQSTGGSFEARTFRLSVPGEHVTDLPPGTWQVLTEAPDLWSAPEWIAPVAGPAETRVMLRLFPAAPVSGLLTGVPQEKIPAHLDVRLAASPGSPQGPKPPSASIVCPVAGNRFQCVLPVGRLDLRLRSTGFIPAYLWDVGVRNGETAHLGTLTLKPGASVVGWVRNEAGREASGARVRLEPETFGLPREPAQVEGLKAMSLEAQTNQRGFFQLENPVPPGRFVVTVEKDLGRARRSGIEIRPGLEAEILEPLVLARPVSLRVSLDPARPPSGARWKVTLERKPDIGPSPEVYRGEAALDGTWQQNGVSPGRYTLYFDDGQMPWHAEPVEVSDQTTNIHVSLGGVQVRGHIRLGDEPLPATLWFRGPSAAQQGRFQSDEQGRFEGVLATEGTWTVDLVSEAEKLQIRLGPVEVRKISGQSHARVDLRVPATRLRGLVVDEHGQAVSQANLSFIVPTKLPSKVATDREGKFDVRGLPVGSLFVHAVKDEMESEWLEARIEEASESPELRLVLQARQAIQGLVHASHGPVPGAQVSATAPPSQATAGSGAEAISGPSGEFTLKLPAGIPAVHLAVLAPGYATRMLFVPLGSEPILDIPLETVGGTLIFDLGDRTLDEIRGTGIGILAHGGTFVPFMTTVRWSLLQRAPQMDPHRLVLPNMEAGDYLLCVGPESYLAIPRGQAPPAHQCSHGSLAPLQELVLPLPSPPLPAG